MHNDAVTGLQISPLRDTERIFALPTRAAREAALLELDHDRHDMVAHFLILKFAAELKRIERPELLFPSELRRTQSPDELLAGVPLHLLDDVKRLARSYADSARIVAGKGGT